MTAYVCAQPRALNSEQPRRRLTRRVAYTTLGLGAASAALASPATASASPLSDAVGSFTGAATGLNATQDPTTPTTPAPSLPSVPSIFEQAEGMLPSNLLRKNSVSADATVQPVTQVPQASPQTAVSTMAGQEPVAQPAPAPQHFGIPQVSQAVVDAHDAWVNSPNTAAQAFGAVGLPTADTFQNVTASFKAAGDYMNDVATAAHNGTLEQKLSTDLGNIGETVGKSIDQAVTNTLNSPEFADVMNGKPLEDVAKAVGILTSPEMITNLAAQAWNYVVGTPPALAESLFSALPALAIPALAYAAGAVPGFIDGTIPGGLLGGLLGALNPLDNLSGLLTALPGSILGGLATGIPGFIASLLMTIPAAIMTPLFTAAIASTWALVAWATLTYAPWVATVIAAAVVSLIGAAIVALVPAFTFLLVSGFSPWGLAGVFFVWFYQTALFFALSWVPFVLLTAWIPTTVYLIGVLPILLAGLAFGTLVGLPLSLAIPLIGIPAITGLSAIPGAITGGIIGFLLGKALSKLANIALGIPLGALAGGLIGSVLGGLPLALTSLPLAALVAWYLGSRTWNRKMGDIANSENGQRIAQLWDEAMRQVTDSLSKLWGRFLDEWGQTETGRFINDLMGSLAGLFAGHQFVDGSMFDAIWKRGGLLGAILGGIPGALTGALLGFIVGLLSPLNLLAAPLGALIGALAGAPLGALAGKLLSTLLGTLVGLGSIPLTFLPNMIALFALLNTLLIPTILAALAVAFIPPLAFAITASTIAWLVVYTIPLVALLIPAVIFTFLTAVFLNPLLNVLTNGFAAWLALIPGLLAFGFATANLIGATITAIIVGMVVGTPVYWLTLPFFLFPALTVPFLILASIPMSIPVALGMSILEAIALGGRGRISSLVCLMFRWERSLVL